MTESTVNQRIAEEIWLHMQTVLIANQIDGPKTREKAFKKVNDNAEAAITKLLVEAQIDELKSILDQGDYLNSIGKTHVTTYKFYVNKMRDRIKHLTASKEEQE